MRACTQSATQARDGVEKKYDTASAQIKRVAFVVKKIVHLIYIDIKYDALRTILNRTY